MKQTEYKHRLNDFFQITKNLYIVLLLERIIEVSMS